MSRSYVSSPQSGLFHRARVRLFGERDAVARQLDDIAKQGAGMARLAHGSAFLLLLLFSLGSLVALGGDALSSVLSQWQSGRVDVPAAISLGVSALLVAAMDVAALYAALVIRLLSTRRASRRDYAIHTVVLVTACLLESSTYLYMAAIYDAPSNPAAWALIVARAFAAPLFSVYLSLARPLPITSRDILAQVELASGQGLIRHAVTIANDTTADLGDKAALFAAASVNTPEDQQRLASLLRAIELRGIPIYVGTANPADPPRLPTGGGTPLGQIEAPQSGPLPLDSARETVANGQIVALPTRVTRRVVSSRGASKRKRAMRGVRTVDSYEPQARAAWASGARSVAKMKAAVPGMSASAASGWVRTLKAEQQAIETQERVAL